MKAAFLTGHGGNEVVTIGERERPPRAPGELTPVSVFNALLATRESTDDTVDLDGARLLVEHRADGRFLKRHRREGLPHAGYTEEYNVNPPGGSRSATETQREERIPADVAFVVGEDGWYSGIDQIRIAYVPGPALTPETLVDLIENVCFCANDDSEADSWDTQHEHFLRDARELAADRKSVV